MLVSTQLLQKPRCFCTPVGLPGRRSRRRLVPTVTAAVKARWCLDARFGHKTDVIKLMQEWVVTVGSVAGLKNDNTQLHHGFVGVAESTIELEVTFDSLADWERFLTSIPAPLHKAWSLKLAEVVVDASPRWTLMHVQPLPSIQDGAAGAGQSQSQSGGSRPSTIESSNVPIIGEQSALVIPTDGTEDWDALMKQSAAQPATSPATPAAPASNVSSPSPTATEPEENVILDWKGEPMKINPGDKLPIRFM